jgi:SAM-dependent methyltransferase
MGSLSAKIVRTLRRDGLLFTLYLVVINLWELIIGWLGKRTWEHPNEFEFDDAAFGTDTKGLFPMYDSDAPAETSVFSEVYHGTDPQVFDRVMRTLNIDFSTYTFVDIGSGKGRALLLASHYPFRQIIGVEFSRDLNDIASRNIELYKSAGRKCTDITALNIDAMDFVLPKGRVLLYLYNPFHSRLMERFVVHIEDMLSKGDHDVTVFYTNPVSIKCWKQSRFFAIEEYVRDSHAILHNVDPTSDSNPPRVGVST